jgi:hypothetical protein
MKKLILFLGSLISIPFMSFSQTNFKWDAVDSVPKSKAQIYSETKLFISETWRSAKDVIQNDDKDGGIILVKGLSVQSMYYQMNDHRWTYSYTLKFLMKENKYRVILEDVKCVSAICGTNSWPLVEACDNCEFPGYMKTSLKKDRYDELLSSLKKDLQSIVDKYQKNMKEQNSKNGDW